MVIQGSVDGLVCEPFAVLHSKDAGDAAKVDLGRAAGAVRPPGLGVGVLMAMVGLAIGGDTQSLLLAYALRPPGAAPPEPLALRLLHPGPAADGGGQRRRLGHRPGRRPRWWSSAAGWNTPTTLVLAWAAGAVAASVFGCRPAAACSPRRPAPSAWLRDTADLGVRYAAEFLGTFGASQAALSVTGSIAGLAAVAQLRGAQVAFGPITTLANGVRVAGTPIAVREQAKGAERLRLVTVAIGGGLALAGRGLDGPGAALPDRFGEAVAGDSWALAREVVPAIAVNNVAAALAAGLLVSLRALADARRSLRGRLATGGLRLVGAAIGAVVAGGPGAAWGLAIGAVLGLGVLQVQYRAALRAQTPSR